MPPASSAEREEERRFNKRTLTIASVASATAAAVTSQLWIAGTWVAAALTPVLVTLISEAMHRPTERIARAWTSEREPRFSGAETPTRREPTAVSGTAGPVRVYRQTSRGAAPSGRSAAARTALTQRTGLSRRRIAIGTVAATAAIAFIVGIATLTTADLVSGGSVGKGSGRSTLFGGSRDNESKQEERERDSTQRERDSTQQEQKQQEQAPDRQQTAPSDEPTTTEPAPDEQPPSDTAPIPPPQAPPGEPVPGSTP
jgi:hypothetical protein